MGNFNKAPNWFWDDKANAPESDSDHYDEPDNDTDSKTEDDDELHVHDPNDTVPDDVLAEAVKIGATEEDAQKKIHENDVLKEGYMRKEGKMVKSWKQRWFVLQKNGVMSYYHSKEEQKKGGVAIASFNVKSMLRLRNKSWTKSDKKKYGIKIYTAHRNWKFLCNNDKERIGWLNAFEVVSGKKTEN